MFPVVDVCQGKCLVWDSCKAHLANRVKKHCRQRNIAMVLIPGGLTLYLQAGDIGIYKDFKDRVSHAINAWKNSDDVEYTAAGNPRPPSNGVLRSWVKDAWNGVSNNNIRRCIQAVGFSPNYEEWHIAKHAVYGQLFQDAWNNTGPREVNPDEFEEVPQDDDIDVIDGTFDGLHLDEE